MEAENMEYELEIVGTASLLMHNARLSNPLDPIARELKKITSKRNKSEEDYGQAARLEFMGSLYYEKEFGPYVPGPNILRCLVDAGRKRKLGTKVTAGVFIRDEINPLADTGPRDQDGLWRDENFRSMVSAKVGMSRVMRTRPQFRQWAVSAVLIVDPEVMDTDDLQQVVQIAGSMIGLGDWRPTYGRFEARLTPLDV
jgi:hypothetical protein